MIAKIYPKDPPELFLSLCDLMFPSTSFKPDPDEPRRRRRRRER
jgi:hypothetical protein